jgi:hypothetical protein
MFGMPRSSVDTINRINIGLMIVSCLAAYALPFELFLFSYAVLGPLHYLTQIAWMHDRGYFTRDARSRRWWLLLVAAAMIVVLYGIVGSLRGRTVAPVWEIGLFYLAFLGALTATDVVGQAARSFVFTIGVVALFAWSGSRSYALVAFLIITIVHVFVFTGAFILYGAVRSRSTSALISLAVFVACAASFFILVPAAQAYSLAAWVRESYGPFNALNAELIRLFRLGAGTTAREIYESRSGLAVMRLIAFAYTYHYLNWFSKTSVIGWYRSARPRAVLIGVVWTLALVIYTRDFRLGMDVLYSLSILHVMLEFPLDQRTFRSLGSELWEFARSERTGDARGDRRVAGGARMKVIE